MSARISVSFVCCLVTAAYFLSATCHGDVVVYDASLGTTPGSQGWLEAVDTNSSQSVIGSRLELDTTFANSERSGYFSESPFNGALRHPTLPDPLDASIGFSIRFDLQVLEEQHAARDDNGDGLADRAGFSLITITDDLRGLELAFFEDRIWVYADASEGNNSLFTQAEGVDFDTTTATSYELAFGNFGYRLTADGNELLTGSLRNYNPSGVDPLLNPYDNDNFIFFGDNTTSAASRVSLANIEVLNAIPEPGLIMPVLFGLAAICRNRRRTC